MGKNCFQECQNTCRDLTFILTRPWFFNILLNVKQNVTIDSILFFVAEPKKFRGMSGS